MSHTRTDRPPPPSYTPDSQRRSGEASEKKERSFVTLIGVPVLLALLAWAAVPIRPIMKSEFDAEITAEITARRTDSIRRDTRYTRDSIDRLNAESRRDSIAESTARKVDILVCRPLPPAEREACLKK